ncbi:MAG: glutaredoxin family protein [Promethearchaeota archaeon]
MSSEVEFIHESGINRSHKAIIYVLSTCGFCHRALTFLRDHSIEFNYVYVDKLERKIVGDLREELKEKFGRRVSYPFLVVDDEKFLVGFNEEDYKKLFELGREFH